MKVLIDTNIILDVLCNRKDFVDASLKVFKYCEAKRITGYISALSVPNIVYIMRKELTREKTKEILSVLTSIFTVIDLREADLLKAADSDMKDYEDAIQSACAARIKAKYIITRNIRDFAAGDIPAVKPEDFFSVDMES